jgi:hypothetical protein
MRRPWPALGRSATGKKHLIHQGASKMVDAPWYIGNADLHSNIQMEMFTIKIGKFAKKHEGRLLLHVNVEAIQLIDKYELAQSLKKNLLSWCSDH